jgi:hypothetical protein
MSNVVPAPLIGEAMGDAIGVESWAKAAGAMSARLARAIPAARVR